MITLVAKDLEDKGWWRGELVGKVGVFPDNFVEVISADDAVSGVLRRWWWCLSGVLRRC